MEKNKSKRGQKMKKGKDNDIDKYFDTTNFDTHMHLEPEIPAKQISTHPLKQEIFCVYDKIEVQVIWLDKASMTQVQKFRLIDNKSEIKSAVFTKDSLLCILCMNGYINFYNYEISEIERGGFHPYKNEEDLGSSPDPSVSKSNLITSSIF